MLILFGQQSGVVAGFAPARAATLIRSKRLLGRIDQARPVPSAAGALCGSNFDLGDIVLQQVVSTLVCLRVRGGKQVV